MQLRPTGSVLTGIGHGQVRPRGKTTITCKVPRRPADHGQQLTFYVTDDYLTILGRQACEDLDLIKRVDTLTSPNTTPSTVSPSQGASKEALLTNYEDVFQGIGAYDKEYHIHVRYATPVAQQPRTLPYAKQSKLKTTLETLKQRGIIADVEGPTDWVHNLVVTEKKNGNMRICLDPRPLNKAIKRELYRIPTLADVQARLAGKTLFTVVDMRDAFWHVKLSKKSARLCTFNTPWERKCFLRMPFGLCSASEFLQQRNDETFGDIPGVHVIADDIIVAGRDGQEHDHTLTQVLERARSKNVKFSLEKVQYNVRQVKYMGHLIGPDGQRPDPEKIKAIVEMPKPEDKKGVQRLLGMIKYLAPFIPGESDITAPLRDLLKDGNEWRWTWQQDAALHEIKRVLTGDPVLALYDQKLPTKIQADASQTGLGACLLQNGRVIAYASRTLTTTEQAYARIEKEMLAITFACKKIHSFIYGKSIQVDTDHKPLESITKKPICVAPPRLQRMMLQLQRYQLNVQYVPVREMHAADTLSMAQIPSTEGTDPAITGIIQVMINSFVCTLPMSAKKKADLQQATAADKELQTLKRTVQVGWPERVGAVDPAIRAYWTIRDELHETEGLLFKGYKIIIPTSLRSDMLGIIHETHQGAERSKERARAVMYWANMTREIEHTVSLCQTCQRFQRSLTKEPLRQHPIPQRPWQKLGADILTHKGNDFLLVADYYSKFVELQLLTDKTAESVVRAMKSMFSRHGIPDEIVCDNMPFGSYRMNKFANEWGFTVTTTSPNYPQSNGFAERNVLTIKNILKKTQHAGGDPYLALLNFRSTPIPGLGASPAQLLMGRPLKTRLPATAEVLQPRPIEGTCQKLRRRQEMKKHHFDKRAAKTKPRRRGASPARKRMGARGSHSKSQHATVVPC